MTEDQKTPARKTARYRAGGPWITRRVVHTIESRFGVAFQWRGNWRFLGLLVLSDKREVTEPDTPAPETRATLQHKEARG